MSVPPPFTVAKYMDVSLPTATIQPTAISKINTGTKKGLFHFGSNKLAT